ncbi:MAG TPA: ABC transporter permease [Pyrinomonadaceae bacterium]|nr:ABC transporter permease [Pyrinomonadaceae bacterium]
MGALWQDIRYGYRMLWKNPGFTLVAIIALALGIGANSAIFSVVNAILLKPLPYKDPQQLVIINHNYPKLNLRATVSAPGYVYYRDHAQSFSDVAATAGWSANLTGGGGEPERLQGMQVTTNLFPMLGAQPARGRAFTAQESQPGNHRVVVLSDALWQRRFGSDPAIVNQTVTLNGESYTVVGIMPPSFQYAREMGQMIDLYSPIAFTPEQLSNDNAGLEYLTVMARLKPGVSIPQAQAELNTIADQLRQVFDTGDSSVWGLTLRSYNELVIGEIRPALFILLAAVAFVLLIACANVANLLLARAAVRQKEIAIRAAMGASRMRIVRQLLTESTLLSVAGGVLGLLLAVWGVDLLLKVNGNKLPRAHEIGLDVNVLLFTLGVSLLTGIFFGLAPAFQTSKTDLHETLKEGGRSGTGTAHRGLRNLLVVAEMALTVVLLVGAGLLVRSFLRLEQVNPGFQPQNILAMQLSLPANKYPEAKQRDAFYQQMLAEVGSLPGVKSVGGVSVLPMGAGGNSRTFTIEGREAPEGQQSPHGDSWAATSDYFKTMSIPLVKGRYFTEGDTAASPNVVIIDEELARKFFPNEEPVGRRITYDDPTSPDAKWREIVGVVGHVKSRGLEGETRPQFYFPYHQVTQAAMYLVVQTQAEPASMAGSVRGAIQKVDKDLPVFRVTTMERLVAESLAQRRFATFLLGVFASVALVLAVVGLYGVMSYSVTQRTREIGLRMALGASARDVLKMVVGQGMMLVVIGLGIGLVASFLLTRVMSSILFDISATDPLTFILISLLLVTVAFLASYIPARRAMRVDPMTALRYE